MFASTLLGKLIETAQLWISLDSRHSVKLDIDGDVLEVTGITRKDQRMLTQYWIDHQTNRSV